MKDLNVRNIPLQEVFMKYTDRTDADFEQDGAKRVRTKCHAHKDSDPSLALYDKRDRGEGWDFYCFVCGAGGSAIDILLDLGIESTKEQAEARLRKDFKLELPTYVDIEHFANLKGLDEQFVRDNGWEDHSAGVIMPYFDHQHNLIAKKVRVKYFGKNKYTFFPFEGSMQDVPYGLHWLDAYSDDEIYICEGETDSVTMRFCGYPVLGIGSNNAWQSKFKHLLDRFNKINVLRDNDEAGLALVRDIARDYPDKTYVTALTGKINDINDFYRDACMRKPEKFKEKFEQLSSFPATPKLFLQELESNPDFIEDETALGFISGVINNAIERERFISKASKLTELTKKTLDDIMMDLTGKGLAKNKRRLGVNLYEEDNCYMKSVIKAGVLKNVRISNFVVRPVHLLDSDGERTRVVKFVNESGITSGNIELTPDDLSSHQAFHKRCISCGDYLFTGDFKDIQALLQIIFNTEIDHIIQPTVIGRLPKGGWLFGNCGIDSKGVMFPVNEFGVIELDNVKYMPVSIDADDEGGSTSLPKLNLEKEPSVDILRPLAEKLYQSYGDYAVWLSLGWTVAGWFSNDIYKQYGFFPYMFVAGKRNSGKTTLAQFCQRPFGFSDHQSAMSIETPTNVGVLRTMGHRASLPQLFDDYRNNVRRIQMKDGLLIDAYNRHGAVKGMRNNRGVRSHPIRGFMMLSGEDIPSNNALRSRCVLVEVAQAKGERSPELLSEVDQLFDDYSAFGMELAKKATDKDYVKSLLDQITTLDGELFNATSDARFAHNYAIFAGAFLHMFGDAIGEENVAKFRHWLIGSTTEDKKETDNDHPVNQFMEALGEMLVSGDVQLGKELDYCPDTETVFVRLKACYNAWKDSARHEADLIGYITLKGYLEVEPYTESTNVRHYFSFGRQRCTSFTIDKLKAHFTDLAEVIQTAERKRRDENEEAPF